MYTPPSFQINDRATLFALMEEFSFATLVTGDAGSLVASHLPLVVQDDASGGRIFGHMARANPQWSSFDGAADALAVFQGPHGYISPSWYTAHPSVPTWNYVVVHAYGAPRIIEDRDTVVGLLRRTVEKYEGGMDEPWPMDLPPDYLEKMVAGIVAFEMPLTRIEGKAKISQNRSEEDRLRVIEALDHSRLPADQHLAKMMRQAELRQK